MYLGRGRSSSAGSAHAQMPLLSVGCQECDCTVKREPACVSRKQQLIFVVQWRIMIAREEESIDFDTLGAQRPGERYRLRRERVGGADGDEHRPQGTRIIGQYDNNVQFGQSRLLLVWNRMIFPNGVPVRELTVAFPVILGGVHPKLSQ
jgi:hypothetical protein